MKTNYFLRNYFGFLFLAAMIVAGSCKKEHPEPPTPPEDSTNTTVKRLSNEDSLKFYVWYINESDSAGNIPLYYWYDQVPPTNPLSSQFDKAEDLLNYMKSFPKVDGKKVDRYSFLDRKGVVSGELQGGVKGDLGFDVTAVYEEQQSSKIGIYVLFVYPGSPAGKAGVERGWKIASVNGTNTLNLTDQSDLSKIAKAIYNDPSAIFTFLRPDGSKTSDINLSRTTYHLNPVLLDTIYTVNNEKVGYFVYNSFISVGSDENGLKAKQEIDDAFSKFKAAGVKDLIIDLRYNGGGSVPSTEYLDNLIAPASANGQVMYKTLYNDPLTAAFNSSDTLRKLYLAPINFSLASNNLNLSRVFFIVSGNTASASELTINNLKPYMDVKLIGDTTYGKPVGFFSIPITFVTDTAGYAHVADMYTINFQSVNKNGKGDYYSGMAPDYSYLGFNVSNWGNTTKDARLHAALNYIKTGSYERSALQRKAYPEEQLRIMPGNKLADPHQFNGMVDERRSAILKRLKK